MSPRRWPAGIAARLPAVYLILLSLFAAGSLLCRPIIVGDTDIWYHLNAGRYIIAHHALPWTSFFSFLTPPREFNDYYWLFDALVFLIYSAAGYIGLIVLRTAVYGATLLAIGRFLLGKDWKTPSFYGCFIFTLYALFLIPRYMLVRPHMFSYLFIILFLTALESRSRWLASLPLVALSWGNLHGVEAPVASMILGSYMIEYYLQRWPAYARVCGAVRTTEAQDQRFLIAAALSALALVLTPLGFRIFSLPWTPIDYAQIIIGELHVLPFRDYISLAIAGGTTGTESSFNLILAVAALCAVASVARRKPRICHLLLLGGGLYLLTRANRMRYDCALLLLPLIKTHPPFEPQPGSQLFARPVRAALLAALLAIPALSLKNMWAHIPHYPFSRHSLPHGVVTFLRHIDVGGKVWNSPNAGGYLEWMLYPRYLISADMQTPFLFLDKDLYLTRESFVEPRLLGLVIRQYSPDFIMAPLTQVGFPDVVRRFPDYVLVFFDDTDALYASRKSRPDIVKSYAQTMDPFRMEERFPKPDKAFRDKPLPPDLARMLAIDPGCINTRWRAASFCALKEDYPGMLIHAEAVIREYPENPYGYIIRGHALNRMGRCDEALASLRQALARNPESSSFKIYREMADVYVTLHQPKKAYELLRRQDAHIPPEDWLENNAPEENSNSLKQEAGRGASIPLLP